MKLLQFKRFFSLGRMAMLFACLTIAVAAYLIFTTSGSSFVVKQWLLHSGEIERIKITKARGNLFRTLEWEGVSVKNIKRFPGPNNATSEKVVLRRTAVSRFQVELKKGKFEVLASEPIFVDGIYSEGLFDGRLAVEIIHYRELIKLFPTLKQINLGEGFFSNLNLRLKGSAANLAVSGALSLHEFLYRGFLLKDAEVALNTTLTQNNDKINVSGQAQAANLIVVPTTIPGCQITAQLFEVSSKGGYEKDFEINIHSGKARFQDADLILFYGSYVNSILNFNVYSKWINVEETVALLGAGEKLKGVSGSLADVDIDFKGVLTKPEVIGEFKIEKLIRSGFLLMNSPGSLNLQVDDILKVPQLQGTVTLKAGEVRGPKTAVVRLRESKLLFKGDPVKPGLDVNGNCAVGGTKIDIGLKGTIDKPEVKLQSKPPLPQEQLMIMLLTNKRWSSAEKSLSEGRISPELARDFVDYFLFDDMGSKLSERLGISEVSITFEKEKKGVGIKKSLTNNLDATYATEQTLTKEGKASVVQKVGGEYKVTENLIVGAEREVRQEDKATPAQQKVPPADKVMLKFQKEF